MIRHQGAYISNAFLVAVPSYETACVLVEEGLILQPENNMTLRWED